MSGVSRRELFSFFLRRLREPEPEPPAPPVERPRPVRPPHLPAPLRPPGALTEYELLDTCTHCGKCVEACPVDAILPLGTDYGPWAGTPHILPRRSPCVLCEGLLCTAACPSGALRRTSERGAVKMGFAIRNWETCLAFTAPPCDVCQQACPIPGAIETDNHGHPRVNFDLCTGCGQCEKVCPTEPASIVVTPASERP